LKFPEISVLVKISVLFIENIAFSIGLLEDASKTKPLIVVWEFEQKFVAQWLKEIRRLLLFS
jgi:hypothetical protein